MSGDLLLLLTPLRQSLERIERKAQPLLNDPALLEREEGQDLLDVICMQFLAAGEALKRLEKLRPGLLAASFPDIDWKGAMGFRDVIAHQYFDLDGVRRELRLRRHRCPGAAANRRAGVWHAQPESTGLSDVEILVRPPSPLWRSPDNA